MSLSAEIFPPSKRGFFGVCLISPKSAVNVGAAIRAAQCFDAAFIITTGRRYHASPTNTMHGERHLPLYAIQQSDPFNHIPHDCEPVAVDLVPGAEPLDTFIHRPRAIYFFGPEDGTLGQDITRRCARRIVIPSLHCLNLAAAVNVVLYDRTAKAAKVTRRECVA